MNTINDRIAQWARAQATLEQVRTENIRNTNTPEAVGALKTATAHAIETTAPRESSGLVEQQFFFQRIAAND